MTEEIFEEIRKSEYGQSPNNLYLTRMGKTISVEMTYPNINEHGIKYVEVDQESVRASDGIRLHYDYERDGWVIEQPTKLSWKDPPYDKGWKEAAFIKSWALRDEQEAWDASLDN